MGRDYSVGDIEIQPLKWAFIYQPETIATVALAFTLSTGSKKHGLGEGDTVFAPHVFLDHGFGNWFVELNLSPNVNIGGKQGLSFEYKSVLSYSFIWESERVAPSVPKQDWVWIPSLEFLGESVFRGEDKGKTFISLLPGATVWHTRSGWQLHTGVQSKSPRAKGVKITSGFYCSSGTISIGLLWAKPVLEIIPHAERRKASTLKSTSIKGGRHME